MPDSSCREHVASGPERASRPAWARQAKSGRTGAKEGAGRGGRKPNGLQQPLQPSKELAAVVGPGPLPRAEVVRQVWACIKRHDL